MKHLISIFIFIVILMSFSSAQDIVLMDGLTPNFTTCDAILTDGGFTVSDYANNSDIVVTICSNNGQGLQIDFLGFAIEDGQDFLTVYDGPNVISPEIPDSPFTGTSISTLTSTGTCLTFHFTSNETVTAAGWQAVLTCVPIGPQQECLIDYDLAISPAYEPGGVCTGGTNYNYCLTINDWGADSPSEFHGFDLDFGPGIDPITLVPVSFPVSCDGLGSWGFYESVTSAGTGLITGPGFFYDSDGDGDPGNNPGDACVGAPPWTFCFDVQIDLCEADESNAGEDASISITTYSDGESGAFNDPNCSTDEVIVIEGEIGCLPPCPGDCDLCPPNATIVNTSPILFCPSDGPPNTLELFVEEFSGTYSISYDTGSGPSTVGGTTADITIPINIPLSGGVVTLTAISDDSCVDIPLTSTIDILPLDPPEITFEADAILCEEEEIDLELTFNDILGESSPPYGVTFDLDDIPGGFFSSPNDSFTLTINQPGVYELTGIESNGCTFPLDGPSVTVSPSGIVEAIISGDTTICQEGVAQVEIELIGTPPFDLTILQDGNFYDSPTYFAGGTQIYFTGDPGIYTLENLSDSNCDGAVSGSATIDEFEVSSMTLSGGGVYCEGEEAPLILESEGTGPWETTYAIDFTPQPSLTISSSPFEINTQVEGDYSLVSALDGNGCLATLEGNAGVIFNAPPTAELNGDITLCDDEIGNLNLFLTGTAPFILIYEIDGLEQEPDTINIPSGFLEVADPGTYTLVSISDAICEGSISGQGTVTFSPSPSADISDVDTICAGIEVELLIEMTGSPNYSIDVFLNGNFFQNFTSDNDSVQFTVSESGEYQIVELTDMNCTSSGLDSTTIYNFPPPDILTSPDTLLCFEDDLTLSGSASGGFGGPFAYQWVVGLDTLQTDILTIQPEDSDTYLFIVDDGCGIAYTQSVSVGLSPFPSFDADNLSIGRCGEGTLVIDTEIPLSLYGDSCVWNVNGQIFNVCDSVEIALTNADAYDVDLFVVTELGCIIDSVFSDLIEVNEVPVAGFSYTPAEPTIAEDIISFQDLSTGATTYSWFIDSLLFSEQARPTLDLPDMDVSHSYTVCMAVANDFGCTDTICDILRVEGDLLVHTPSAFTPDGDQVNDSWAPMIVGAIEDEYLLRIYGRSGQVIWETTDSNQRWNGQGAEDESYYSGDSVYFWQLEIRRLGSADKRSFQGIVTLVR